MTSRFLSKLLAAGGMTLALMGAGSAHAATYELQFTGTHVSGDIFATTTGTAVSGISGFVTDSEVAAGSFAITGLSPYASSDNTFSAGSPHVTFGGLSFSTLAGGDYNLANLDGQNGFVFLSSMLNPGGGIQAQGLTNIALTVTAVPEPAPFALMLAGIVGLIGVTRRRAAR